MITGQRVRVCQRDAWTGKVKWEGCGTVVAFLLAQSSAEGYVDTSARIVVAADDNRFRFCRTNEVVIEPTFADVKAP